MFDLGARVKEVGLDAARQGVLVLLAAIGGLWLTAAAVFALAPLATLPGAMAIVGGVLVAPLAGATLWRSLFKPKAPPPPPEPPVQPLVSRVAGLAARFSDRYPALTAFAAVAAGVLAMRAPKLAANFAEILADVVDAWERNQRQRPPEG